MDNLLPVSKGVADQENARVKHMSSWHVEKSNPRDNANIPYGLVDLKAGEDVYEEKWLVNEPPEPEPNKRNLEINYEKGVDPSPLSATERGVAEAGMIAMPKADDLSSTGSLRSAHRKMSTSDELIISVSNLMFTQMDTYMQRAGSISTSVLRPNMQREHNLSQRMAAADAKAPTSRPLSVLLAPLERVCVTVSGRHEVQEFDFVPGGIGMEIEIKYDRLVCTNVLPDSQAHRYESELRDSEIVAVNGGRVISLDDFQDAITAAREHGKVTIAAVTPKRGTKRVDNFHAQFAATKKSTVKSLFGGLLSGGVDLDHQHGMELPAAGSDDDSEDDGVGDEDEEEKKEEDVSAAASKDGAGADDGGGDAQDAKDAAAAASRPDSKESEDGEGSTAWFDAPSNDSLDSDDSDDNVTSIRKKPVFGSSHKAKVAAEEEKLQLRADEDGGEQLTMGRAQRKGGADDVEDHKFVDMDDFKADDDEEEEEEEEEDMATEMVSMSVSVVKSEEAVNVDEGEADTWDFATALDHEEVVPYSQVVCIPPALQRSLDWGEPRHHIQFVNYSAEWTVRVCWVDEEGALVPRMTLTPDGAAKHLEETSPAHVWCVVAYKTKEGEKAADMELVGDPSRHQPTAMVFIRPNRESLVASNFVSMTWKPWCSISATQKARPKELPAHHRGGHLSPKPDEINPNILFSIMDER